MFKIVSKTLPHSALENMRNTLFDAGLKTNVVGTISGELPKKNSFRISVSPKNGYYTNRTHICNEKHDVIFDDVPSEDLIRKLLKVTEISKFAKERGFSICLVDISDAYVWVEYSKPFSDENNYGFVKGYKATADDIAYCNSFNSEYGV
jgi:hypothetical protein